MIDVPSDLPTGYSDVPALVASTGASGTDEDAAWLRMLVVTGYAPSSSVVEQPFFPRIGTSPSVDDRREAASSSATSSDESSRAVDPMALSVPEQLREVLAALSLSKSQLAQVLGVSRPTLYDWLEDKEPSPGNELRITTLLRLLARAGVTSSAPLNARFIRQPLGLGQPSVLDLLVAEPLDGDEIARALQHARTVGEEAVSKRQRREERLRALGFEDPDDEQRREQLAANVALIDWPR